MPQLDRIVFFDVYFCICIVFFFFYFILLLFFFFPTFLNQVLLRHWYVLIELSNDFFVSTLMKSQCVHFRSFSVRNLNFYEKEFFQLPTLFKVLNKSL